VSLYANLSQVKELLTSSEAAPDRTDYDDALYELIETASRRVDDYFFKDRPMFAPYTETRRFPVMDGNVNSAQHTFRFGDSLLELTAVNATGTALTLTTHVTAYPDSTRPPFNQLLLREDATIASWYTRNCSGSASDVPTYVDVTGVWGFHRNYAKAWKAVDTLAAAMSDTTTKTLTVGNVDGANLSLISPRIDRGSILKIDSEVLNVVGVNTNTNVITVEERGANGTTAATHTNGSTVSVWQVEPAVRFAVSRQAGLLLSRRGAYVTVEITGGGALMYPSDWLWEVKNVMARYGYD